MPHALWSDDRRISSVDADGGLGAGLGDAGGVGDDAAVCTGGLTCDAVGPEDGGVGVRVPVEGVLQTQTVLAVVGGVAGEDEGDPAAGALIVLLPVKGVVDVQVALGRSMRASTTACSSSRPRAT